MAVSNKALATTAFLGIIMEKLQQLFIANAQINGGEPNAFVVCVMGAVVCWILFLLAGIVHKILDLVCSHTLWDVVIVDCGQACGTLIRIVFVDFGKACGSAIKELWACCTRHNINYIFSVFIAWKALPFVIGYLEKEKYIVAARFD